MAARRLAQRLDLAACLALALAALCLWPASAARLAAWTGAALGGGSAGAREPLTVVLVDVSASVWRTRDGLGGRFEELLDELAADGAGGAGGADTLAVARFARDVVALREPGSLGPSGSLGSPERRVLADELVAGAFQLGPAGDGTDLAGALRLASEWIGEGVRRPGSRVVVLGDGSFTGADPTPFLEALELRGVPVRRASPGSPTRVDLALAELRLPSGPAAGAPLGVELLVAPSAASAAPGQHLSEGRVRLTVALDPGGTLEFERALDPLALASGGQRLRLSLGSARPGRVRVEATAAWLDAAGRVVPDPVPENDRAQGFVDVGDAWTVALLAPPGMRADRRDAWARWCEGLAAAGPGDEFDFEPLSPEGFARRTAPVDLVLSLDVPLASAPELGLEAHLAGGGGWWALGAEALFAGDRAELVRLAPLVPAEAGERRVVFLVDGSGSMAGAPFEQLVEAVLGAMEAAPSSDRFELWTFAGRVESRHRLGPGGPDTSRAAEALLGARPPRGATDLLAALSELADLSDLSDLSDLNGAAGDAPPDLVVLLTDGGQGGLPERPAAAELAAFAARADALRGSLEAAGGRLVVCGLGAEPRADTLGALAGPAGWRPAGAANGGGLTELFREELGRGRWRHVERPRPGGSGAGRWTEPLAAALAELEPWPGVRVQRTRSIAGPAGGVLLESGDGQPVLALDRRGRGAVAVFPGLPFRRESAPASEGPGSGPVPVEGARAVLRALARAGDADGPERDPRLAYARPEGRGPGRLVLSGVPVGWPARLACRFADGSVQVLATPAQLGGADPRARRQGLELEGLELPPAGPVEILAAPGGAPGGAPEGPPLGTTAWAGADAGEHAARPRRLTPGSATPNLAAPGRGGTLLGPALALVGVALAALVASAGLRRA